MKLYIAGPMTGVPEFNFPLFLKAAKYLRGLGYEVFCPAEKDIERHGGVDISKGNMTGDAREAALKYGFSKRQALRDDMEYICMEAEGIVMLPGWEDSPGATAEYHLSRALGHMLFRILEDEDGSLTLVSRWTGAQNAGT